MYRSLLALVLALSISVADAAGLLDTQAVESAAFTEKLPSKEVELVPSGKWLELGVARSPGT